MDDFQEVVSQIRGAMRAATSDLDAPSGDLRDILAFLVKVTQVVDQAFQDIYALAVELAYLDAAEVGDERTRRLQMELELLTARSHYRESLEICSRLKHLKEQFEDHVKTAIAGLAAGQDWQQIFWLIEDREGRIIRLVESSADVLRQQLRNMRDGDTTSVNREARNLADQLRPMLNELREMTNNILGLSGRQGFLELTRDRNALRQAANFIINKGGIQMTRDTYVGRNVGAMGPNASATNTTITDNHGADIQAADLLKLAAELATLKQAMLAEVLKDPSKTEHLEAVAAISAAEDAAKNGEGSSVVDKLKAAGGWALETATKIGVSVATEAIKKSMGLA